MPDIPAKPFGEALRRAQTQQDIAKGIGDRLREEDAQRAAGATGEGDQK